MKMLFISLLLAGTILASCKKEGYLSTNTVMDLVDTTAQIKYSGSFINGPFGTTTGKVKILFKFDKYTLVLDSFNVNNGPDLHVYLSKEEQPINFIDFGRLTSTNGTQLYNISGMPDFGSYKYILVHCQQFNHLFGSAYIQ